jgi:hypothetical protein
VKIPDKWPTSEDWRIPEVEEWLRNLSSEQVVDLQCMINDVYRDRGFPMPETTPEQRDAAETAIRDFCRPKQ